ncbi:MAG: hypothetical protein ACD_18C00146G0002 [uncultured bacterium]|uniref:Uncharacterized protein n=1 Tax=Candidatus Magasanikbacteria bacterium RIFOXYC12_FULL_33_11 TaxID=1798701 RepID=A0A1F6NQS5_9BACT|nr:MAG: hypothetical protein ACD_18C00146G0002 [uncultured bacterium]OGH86316.1 MAG: hypothetical protein A2493_00990 [Candidatus Magasanikbacteria bacterium RIFOXYC12_FULL_33_11]OGH90545.1 MAG: hypothetical protein A2507_03895 [Candidatus Magasanikbacteria bacterium RIFOXYD12_FULL_33_17]HAO52362.1 hypothetical protein [Candidatus Magasanikbacteria bacterium]
MDNNITIDNLAKIISEKILNYENFIPKEINFILDKDQKRELMILDLFNMTKAVSRSFEDKNELLKKILDKIHSLSYTKYCENEEDENKFEELLNERYFVYYSIFNSKSDSTLLLLSNNTLLTILGEDNAKKNKDMFLFWLTFLKNMFGQTYLNRCIFLKDMQEKYIIE